MSEKEIKKGPGRPPNTGLSFDPKTTKTVSITKSTNDLAIELFGTRGKAIDLAVKHSKLILSAEKQKK